MKMTRIFPFTAIYSQYSCIRQLSPQYERQSKIRCLKEINDTITAFLFAAENKDSAQVGLASTSS